MEKKSRTFLPPISKYRMKIDIDEAIKIITNIDGSASTAIFVPGLETGWDGDTTILGASPFTFIGSAAPISEVIFLSSARRDSLYFSPIVL